MAKRIIVDTNVLIRNAEIFEDDTYNGIEIIIPTYVLSECDNHKKKDGILGYQARKLARAMDNVISQGNSRGETLSGGITTEGGAILKVFTPTLMQEFRIKVISGFSTYIDDKIIATMRLFFKNDIILTGDLNLRAKANAIGIEVLYTTKSTTNNLSDLYTGRVKLTIKEDRDMAYITKGDTRPLLDAFEKKLDRKPYPNEFVTATGFGKKFMGRFDVKKNKIVELKLGYTKAYGFKARNDEQKMLFDVLLNPDIKLVSITGKAGTGKTFGALCSAFEQVIENDDYEKILIGKNTAPLDRYSYQGFSTGDTNEKLMTHMGSYLSNFENMHPRREDCEKDNKKINNDGLKIFDTYNRMGKLDLLDISSILGSSFNNKFIIIDEAQSFDTMALKSILTRAGENTKIILLGDILQSTQANLSGNQSGLYNAVNWLKEIDEVAHITLSDVERSSLVRKVSEVFEENMFG